ncbi:MAG TPA: ankyrin repeat domain-containing protein [Pyrinomonadaceae bacterium]|nr:ankyrin repeat domain-containing protein [Pyrinomonadaceae bacterium]
MAETNSWFPELEEKSVFIAAPGDVAYLREAVRQELSELKKRAADDYGITPYLWEIDKAKDGFSQYLPAQGDIPLPSDPNCVAVICIFGERVGTPLPSDFPLTHLGGCPALRSESKHRLLSSTSDVDPAAVENAFPLTGSIFEYLVAVAAYPQRPLLLMFVGDNSILDNKKELINRKWGLWHLRNEAKKSFGEDEAGYDDWKAAELKPQLRWLNNFLRYLVDDRGLYIQPVRGEEEARAKIREFLKVSLDIQTTESLQHPFKYLESYVESDNPIFFGRKATRDHAIDEIETLLNTPAKLPFFGITGSSGAGKSSFLRAGVIARLTHSLAMGQFVGTVIKPSDLSPEAGDGDSNLLSVLYEHCLEALSPLNPDLNVPNCLARLDEIKPQSRPAYIVRELIEILDEGENKKRRFVLGLDQLEECLEDSGSIETSRWLPLFEFVDHAVRSKRIVVAYSLKNNQLNRFHENTILNSLFNKGSSIALHFPAEEIDEIIQNPFYSLGLELEDALTQQLRTNILNLVGGVLNSTSASILPLVSVTLSRMYDHWQRHAATPAAGPGEITLQISNSKNGESLSRQFSSLESSTSTTKSKLLTFAEYQGFTNFADCIDQLGTEAVTQAETESKNLRNQERALARILRRLVTPSASESKPLALRPAMIPADLRTSPMFRALLEKRLIVEASWNRVRLVHESVMEYWKKAHQWAKDERDMLRISTQLMISANDWRDHGYPDEMIRGLGENEINNAARLLGQWGDDFAAADAQLKLDEENLLLLKFLLVTLKTYPRPRSVILNDPKGNTHFHAAAFAGATDLIKQYLEMDPACATLQRSGDNRTALFGAIGSDRVEAVKLLLDYGAPVNGLDKDGWTPFHFAAFDGKLQAIDLLLKRGADPVQIGPKENQALHLAAASGYEQVVVRLLSDNRVDPNARTDNQWTALHGASSAGHDRVVAGLLANTRTRPNPRNSDWMTPLHLAALYGHDTVVASLLADSRIDREPRASEKSTPLHLAAQNGHVAVVKQLLADPEVNPTGNQLWQQTPLHTAIQNGQTAVVECLLADKRVRYDTLDFSGQTALTRLPASNQGEIAVLLANAGASLPFWTKPTLDATGRIIMVRRASKEEISDKLFADLNSNNNPVWEIPPLIKGDWIDVDATEATSLLAQATQYLSLIQGDAPTQFTAVRKLPLLFYPEGSFLVEALAYRNHDFCGYLTFIHDPSGTCILDGTSPPIHEYNNRQRPVFDETIKVSQYLRFFCSVIGGQEGTFVIVERPQQIPWTPNADEQQKQFVEDKIKEIKFVNTIETAEGLSWELEADVVYSHSIFRATFRVMNSGMVEMGQDTPMAAQLDLFDSKFQSGLRMMYSAVTESTEGQQIAEDARNQKIISVLRLLGEVSGDLMLTLRQARVLMDIFANHGTTATATEARLEIDSSLVRSAVEVLANKKIIEIKQADDGAKPAEMYVTSEVEPILQRGGAIFLPRTPNFEMFLKEFEMALGKLPEPDRTLTAALIMAYLRSRQQLDLDELIELVGSPDADQIIDVFKKLQDVGYVVDSE